MLGLRQINGNSNRKDDGRELTLRNNVSERGIVCGSFGSMAPDLGVRV